ncbi:MAG: ATP-binding protein [Planctomycetota bacterium]
MSATESPKREGRGGSPGRRLTWLYVAALSTVALLSLGAQALIQWQLSNGESDSRVINFAGRQRMLSQRLTKCALVIQTDGADAGAARDELAETLELWARTHRGLRQGDADLGLPGRNSLPIERLFEEIDSAFEVMQAAAEQLLASPPDESSSADAVAAIRSSEATFLRGMDAVVSRYVVEAEQKVTRLRRIESAILALTLGVLVAEGLLIFRPAVERIEATAHRQRLMRRRLRRAKAGAETASEAKSRFLANVSHELRTPMTAVIGMAELAREERDDETRAMYLATMLEAGGSLQALLDDLIDLARVDTGELRLDPAPFRPIDVVQRVRRMMTPLAGGKGLTLTTWGEPSAPGWLLGDARRIEQVLINLVANAIKCTPSGDVSLGFTIARQERDASVVAFSVRDTGVGIGVPDQERVFEPFFRTREGEAESTSGAGLGLAICRSIADAMDAKLQLLSSEGIGSTLTFTVRLPHTAEPERIEPQDARPATETMRRVLIVEDTEVNQVLLREYLERAGWCPAVAPAGERALQLIGEQLASGADDVRGGFDAVVVDQRLPGITGTETATRIRAILAGAASMPRLVCVTADPTIASGDDGAIFDAVVAKPIDRAKLLAAVEGEPSPSQTPAEDTVMKTTVRGESTFADKLAAAYLAVCDGQLDELNQAIKVGDLRTGELLAHRFRGQVGYFGEQPLVAELGRLEQACIDGRGDEAAELMTLVDPKLTALGRRLAAETRPPAAVSSPRQPSRSG